MHCGDTYPASVGALAAAVAQGLSDEQIGLLAALFTLLGDSLALLLATRACAAPLVPPCRVQTDI